MANYFASFRNDKEKRQRWLIHLFPIFLAAALMLWTAIMSPHTVRGENGFMNILVGVTFPIVFMWHIMLIFLSKKTIEYMREILYAVVSIPIFFYIWMGCMCALGKEC